MQIDEQWGHLVNTVERPEADRFTFGSNKTLFQCSRAEIKSFCFFSTLVSENDFFEIKVCRSRFRFTGIGEKHILKGSCNFNF